MPVAYKQNEAVVLRKVDFSETSLIVTVLTPDFGRMALLAKGARRKGSSLGPALDTFNRVELTFTWKENRQVQNLVEAGVISSYGTIKSDIQRSAAAAFVLDVALHASWENHPAPELFDALVNGLDAFADRNADPLVAAAGGVYALLEGAGIAPAHTDEESLARLRGAVGTRREQARRALMCLEEGGTSLERAAAEQALDYLHDYAAYHLEAPLKSYGFLKQILRTD